MGEIVFVTGNKHKFDELKTIIPNAIQEDIDLPEIQASLEEIIIAKAEAAQKACGKPVLVEDTGLFYDGWSGLPGPYVKHFLKTLGNDGLWQLMKYSEVRTAQARCMIGYSPKPGTVHIFEGYVNGSICEPRGTGNFGKAGWDAIFLPENKTQTFGEMSQAEKTGISHRTMALKKVQKFLENYSS